jgi:NAD(P)-dependent dehydrogenase (short-subunit alcohol dehydrogenase family)
MNILVTGASKGIGRAIAQRLKALGNLYITGRNEEALKSVGAKGYCVCDLTKDLSILNQFIIDNSIDVLVNNAGTYIYGAIDKVNIEDVKKVYDTNLYAPTQLIMAAVPYMKAHNWGRIINIGSISGVMGEAYASSYSASKAGLLGLTKALALELAQDNITINTINPGWVDTELGMDSINESEFSKDEIIECIPQRRFVKPDEIAALVQFLISEDAKGITGQGINLCAGLSVGI